MNPNENANKSENQVANFLRTIQENFLLNCGSLDVSKLIENGYFIPKRGKDGAISEFSTSIE